MILHIDFSMPLNGSTTKRRRKKISFNNTITKREFTKRSPDKVVISNVTLRQKSHITKTEFAKTPSKKRNFQIRHL